MWRRVVLVAAALAVVTSLTWYYRWRDTPVAVTGATLSWTASMNHPGPAVRTKIGPGRARRLADAINDAPRSGGGPVVCPAADGSKVTVKFASRLGPYPAVTIALTGCAGPHGRLMTSRLQRLLTALEPAGFHK